MQPGGGVLCTEDAIPKACAHPQKPSGIKIRMLCFLCGLYLIRASGITKQTDSFSEPKVAFFHKNKMFQIYFIMLLTDGTFFVYVYEAQAWEKKNPQEVQYPINIL